LPPGSYCQKSKKEHENSFSGVAEKSQVDALQSLSEDGHVTVPTSSSMLDGIDKAGDSKAAIYPLILSTMSNNVMYGAKANQIGDGPSKPVILVRSKYNAMDHVADRARRSEGGLAPIHCLVDIAKYMHHMVPSRNGGNTVNELARDIIRESVQKYYFDGVELICLTMDVPANISIIRFIPHDKRGKVDDIKIPHGSLNRVKNGTDDLTQYGARSDMLKCGDQHFIELLFNMICNQARLLENGVWQLHRTVQGFALSIVGGSPQACVVVGVGGKKNIRLNTNSIRIPCRDLEQELWRAEIVKIEEGEMMVYAAMTAIFKMGFTHQNSNEGIDCVANIYSDDSDAFAGISMQAIYYLESTCILHDKKFFGAVYLHGPPKSIAQISKLGNIFKTNIPVDRDLCPTGKGFQFIVDLISVYYNLEQDSSLPVLPPVIVPYLRLQCPTH